MYRDLVYGSPGVTADTLSRYYKDSSFGVKPGDVERTYSPGGRDDVTVVRDKSFGVPHVYATTRAGAMFALGYVAAEDRLFFIDILRHLGRAQLASFAGGAPGNRAFDQMQWSVAPYTEADFQKQIDFGLAPTARRASRCSQDSDAYVAGINRYISEAKLDPTKMPGEYAAINQPRARRRGRRATSSHGALVGGIFGQGGGGEVEQAQLLQAWQDRFGAPAAPSCGVSSTASTIPRPTTRSRQALRLPADAAQARAGRQRDPRQGLGPNEPSSRAASTPATARLGAALGWSAAAGCWPSRASNSKRALGPRRASRSPGTRSLVFGPAGRYFAPQILMEQDVHAPGTDGARRPSSRG
jgi:hypothetical protein